jgi:hypothetical protein
LLCETETILLTEIGQALYGDRWQTSLANDLRVADRTKRRWVSGASPIPPGIWAEIDEILAERPLYQGCSLQNRGTR